MKPKIKRSHYRKNINQVYYLLKLKPSCNKIQKCAQIILLHDEFYTLGTDDDLNLKRKWKLHKLFPLLLYSPFD